ncbi:MAG: hypothetical protein OXL41_04500 [Nitrospinae bacterium]|nr:hypothetical protein [Nitrospinota bacterium]
MSQEEDLPALEKADARNLEEWIHVHTTPSMAAGGTLRTMCGNSFSTGCAKKFNSPFFDT